MSKLEINNKLSKKKLEELSISQGEHFKSLSKDEVKNIKLVGQYFDLLYDVRVTRNKLGITQQELSLKSGIPRETISKIESGHRNVTLTKLDKLAEAMGKAVEIRFV